MFIDSDIEEKTVESVEVNTEQTEAEKLEKFELMCYFTQKASHERSVL